MAKWQRCGLQNRYSRVRIPPAPPSAGRRPSRLIGRAYGKSEQIASMACRWVSRFPPPTRRKPARNVWINPCARILLKRQGWYTVVGHLSQMRRIFLTAALGVALLLPAQLGAQADAPVLKLIRDYIEALRVQAGIPGLAVAVVGANSIVYEQAFGRQDVERSIAARPDTPFHVDGLTQLFTASYLLRCVEEGRLSLDDRIGDYKSDVPEPNATIRQLLTHTSGPAASPTFQYHPERLDPLTVVVRACAIESFRGSTMDTLDRLAMRDSVPGVDAPQLVPPSEGIPTTAEKARYARILERLAVPYRVDQRKRATPSRLSGDDADAGGRPDFDGPRPGAIRSGDEGRRPAPSGDARRSMDTGGGRRRCRTGSAGSPGHIAASGSSGSSASARTHRRR